MLDRLDRQAFSVVLEAPDAAALTAFCERLLDPAGHPVLSLGPHPLTTRGANSADGSIVPWQ